MVELYNGDCLEIMPTLAPGSVDLVLCDLPYGTTQNKWDSIIPFEALWREYNRLTRRDRALVFTSAQPFTSQIVMSALSYFKQDYLAQECR